MAYTSLGNGFEITGANYIDKRIVLTKEQMLNAEDDFFLPDVYFAFCPDDNQWYTYDINNDEDPETGKYRLMPTGLVNDVLVNGVSVVEDKIAKVDVIDDVKVDGASVVEDNVANISLDHKQNKLTAGQFISLNNDVISVDGLKQYESGYGINIDDAGNIAVNPAVVPTVDMIPDATSDLINDSGFITNAVANLEHYYLNTEVYSKPEIDYMISQMAGGVTLSVVADLPSTGEPNVIYLVRRSIDSNIYDQWIYQPGYQTPWIQVGSTEVDLSNYYTKTEVDALLAQKQEVLTAGAGISKNNGLISIDMGDTLTTTGNKLDVKQATPYQKGVVAYDDNTIKMNALGQLYSIGGGGGTEYTAGPNIQISGNVISATDTTYRNGNAIEIGRDNSINVLTDDQTIKINRNNELYMDAVAIDTGEGINISRDGVISIIPSEVAEAIDLDEKQDKFELGENVYYTTVGGVKYLNATGGSGPGGEVSFSTIKGYPTDNANLRSALNAKQDSLVPGSGITISGNVISATGASTTTNFRDLNGSPYDNTNLAAALNNKRNASDPISASDISGLAPVATTGSYNDLSNKPAIPTVNNSQITIKQGSNVKGTFTLNQNNDSIIELDAGGGSAPNNGKLTLYKNNTASTYNKIAEFTADQATNVNAVIKIPTFSYNSSTGVLTITDIN